MTRDSRCHELPREQKVDNGRLTTKMAETCFVKLPTLDDNLRKQPNAKDLLTYKAMTKQGKSLETLPAKMKGKTEESDVCMQTGKRITRFFFVFFFTLSGYSHPR